jgi:hypothetical protein
MFSTGCAVVRTGGKRSDGLSNEIINEKLFENIKNQNITTNNFFIKKAEIEISTQERTQKILGSLKFKKPDKYLISLKSREGIEAARIFISDDTILINDRISRKQYYGSSKYLKTKYGISAAVLPVIIGDYISDTLSDSNPTKCSGGKMDIDGIVSEIKIRYVIDCKKGKSILVITGNSLNEGGIEIQYDDFFKKGNIITPGKIGIKDTKRKTKIEIKIQKIESPWNGNVEFIPGNRYEIIQLL